MDNGARISYGNKMGQMKNPVRWVVSLASILCMMLYLSGCASKQVETVELPKFTKADMKYKSIYVENFTISPKGVDEKEAAAHLAESQSSCVNELTKSGLFDNVKSGPKGAASGSGLIAQGELTKLRIVGGAARFWVGGLAGRSNMTLHVKVVDAVTGKVVAEKDIDEDTNPIAGAWSLGASDRGLPEKVGSLIAQYVVESAKK